MDLEKMDTSSPDGEWGSKWKAHPDRGNDMYQVAPGGNTVFINGDPKFDPEDNVFSRRKEGKEKKGRE